MSPTTPADRLIVAADFKPEDYASAAEVERIRGRILALADHLANTRVYIKLNSALRVFGYGIIDDIRSRGVRVFADLKLNDIPETMGIDAYFLKRHRPELLTVMASAGQAGVSAVTSALLDTTEVLAVTVLTTFDDKDSDRIYGLSAREAVLRLAEPASDGGCHGFVASAHEARAIREQIPDRRFTINTPGIRPVWSQVENDDQRRVMTPAQAIETGVDRIIIGRPILKAADPREAVKRTLDEIAQAGG